MVFIINRLELFVFKHACILVTKNTKTMWKLA